MDSVATDGEHLYAAVTVDVEHGHLLQPRHTQVPTEKSYGIKTQEMP